MDERRQIHRLNGSVQDGGFLQSEAWRSVQDAAGRRTMHFEQEGWWANIIEHALPIVGKYWYAPRGPVVEQGAQGPIQELVRAARQGGIGWIRIEPDSAEQLEEIRQATAGTVVRKAPHDVQPKEILVMDISLPEEDLLARMKSKTRYNIRLAERKGIRVLMTREKRYREAFFDLIAVTAARDGIVPHPRPYYEAMLDTLPESYWELCIAEHDGAVLAANLVIFFGDTATYLHGASADEHRELMAPYLTQWVSIREAKRRGCVRYDLGGVSREKGSWAGITRFKEGFAPQTAQKVFPGAYDIVVNPWKYRLYGILTNIRKHV